MGPSRKAIADEFLRLHKSSSFAWVGQWISDEQWTKCIKNNAEPLSSLTVRDFNEAISKDDRFKPFLRSEEWNANGLYFNKVKVYHCNISFYYVAKSNERPSFAHTTKEWEYFFDYNQIRQSKRIRDGDGKSAGDLNEIIQPCVGCSITIESATDMQNEERNTRRKLLKDIFWYDKRLCKLFFADDVEHTLQDCILKLEQAEFNAAKLESLVNESSSNPLDSQQLLSIQKKVLYLH